jgi:hypothetical protein
VRYSDDVTRLHDDENLPPGTQTVIEAGLAEHDRLPTVMAEAEAIIARRRALVLRARAMGVSGYRLAKLYGVSQTSISNWCQGKDGD